MTQGDEMAEVTEADLRRAEGEAMTGPVQNTDRELYREDTGDPAGSYYENSLFVTEHGSVGMNVGGTVIVQPIAEWHRQARRPASRRRQAEDGVSQVCVHCGWFIEYEVPKAPAEPGWVHTLYRPDPPTQPKPCSNPEPEEKP